MLINETDDEIRVAIAVDNVLQEMLIEHRTCEQTKNNIYKGTTVQIQPSLQAAFVDFGSKKHGFLPSNEINPVLFTKKSQKVSSSIQQKIKKNQPLLVQVTREAVDHKGAALTTNISIPGRFMVLMPDSNKSGISKKIEDADERERLKSFLSGIDEEKHAVIIRTAGLGRELIELKKDYTTLKKTWEEIQKDFHNKNKPGLILEEADVVTRTLRDYYTEEINEIWVDNPETFQKVLTFLKQVAPRRQKDLKLFVGDRSLFSSYKIERQVEQLTSREVRLPSGGSIVIDQTEALVAIDVNSGKSNQEDDIDATALRTNLEAAKEVARQLRLRNLGGLIVIDFIDLEADVSRKKVEEELKSSMSRDKAQRKYNPISQFGLLEMSRQRLSVGISRTVESVCPTCGGKGRIPSLLASTNLIIRSIREMAAKGNLLELEGELPLELANLLLNERRQSITDLELEFGISILLRGNPELIMFNVSQLKSVLEKKKPSAQESHQAKKEAQKTEPSKKKGRQKEKEQSAKKIENIAEVKEDTNLFEQSESVPEPVDKQAAPVEEKKAVDKTKSPAKESKKQKTSSNKKKQKKSTNNTDTSIHPNCLFTDIQELDNDELEEISNSFENRLKGKADNQAPAIIDSKYLWRENKTDADGKIESKPTEDSIGNSKKETDSISIKSEPNKDKPANSKKKTTRKKPAAKKSAKTEVKKKAQPSKPVDESELPSDKKSLKDQKAEKKKPAKKAPKKSSTKKRPVAKPDKKAEAKNSKSASGKSEKKVPQKQKKEKVSKESVKATKKSSASKSTPKRRETSTKKAVKKAATSKPKAAKNKSSVDKEKPSKKK